VHIVSRTKDQEPKDWKEKDGWNECPNLQAKTGDDCLEELFPGSTKVVPAGACKRCGSEHPCEHKNASEE
jgi:hypothetical protein